MSQSRIQTLSLFTPGNLELSLNFMQYFSKLISQVLSEEIKEGIKE